MDEENHFGDIKYIHLVTNEDGEKFHNQIVNVINSGVFAELYVEIKY